jgi:hypothetical protein
MAFTQHSQHLGKDEASSLQEIKTRTMGAKIQTAKAPSHYETQTIQAS